MEVIKRIEALIKNKGISKGTFLKAIGQNKSTWGNWERGASKTYYEYIPQIAQYLNVSTDYLFGLSDEPMPRNKNIKFFQAAHSIDNHPPEIVYTNEEESKRISKAPNITTDENL